MGALLGLLALASAVHAVADQPVIDFSLPQATNAKRPESQALTKLIQRKLPDQPASTVRRVSEDFLAHLREVSPIIAENLESGQMAEEDLSSRLDIFIAEHPEYSGAASNVATQDPRTRVANALSAASDLASTPDERLALADRFMDRLGALSETSLAALKTGKMGDDELGSRLAVFESDLRSEKAAAAADPAVAAALPFIDSYIKANFGNTAAPMDSICERGYVVSGANNRRDFVIFRKRPRFLRLHIMQEGIVVGVLGFDGASAWKEVAGRAPGNASSGEAKLLEGDSRFQDPLVGYRERGASVRLAGHPAGGPVSLEVKEQDGTQMVVELDSASFAETALRTRQADGKVREVRFSDYRKIGRVNIAYAQEEWLDGKLQSSTRFSEVKLDPGLVDTFFEKPKSVSFSFMDFMGALAVWEARNRQPITANLGGKTP